MVQRKFRVVPVADSFIIRASEVKQERDTLVFVGEDGAVMARFPIDQVDFHADITQREVG